MKYKFDKPYTIKDYNTNNAWGFGGTRGHKLTFSEDLYLIIGNAGTRHEGEFPHTTLYYKDETYTYHSRVLDLGGYDEKHLQLANMWINAIIDKTIVKTYEEDHHFLTLTLP